MPRNSAGSYSLPSGNPVVGGTAIQSSWANTTLADIANEVTNSVDRSGRGSMTAPLKLSDGSVAAPSITFASDPNNGFYRGGPDEWSGSAGGVEVIKLTVNGVEFPQTGITVGGVTFVPTSYARLDGATFSGSVTFATYPAVTARCAFYARRKQELPFQTTGGIAIFPTEEFDLGSNYNPTTGEFTAPAAGVYHFSASSMGQNTSGSDVYRLLGFVVNGVVSSGGNSKVYAEAYELVPNNIIGTVTISATLSLNAADVVTVRPANGFYGAGAYTATDPLSTGHFAGHRVV